MNKYLMFAIVTMGAVADALEDGKISQQEIEEFALLMIREIPKLFK